MNKLFLLMVFICISCSVMSQPPSPDKTYGQLFTDVQMNRIFPDGKTFVDCTPKRNSTDIMYDYGLKKGSNFDVKKFVLDNFDLPASPPAFNEFVQEKDVSKHIKTLWSVLKREADKDVEGSSLLPLPYPYIVPGGRFREIYYWDSYFTMLGLKESGEVRMIENMIKNFAFLIDKYDHIPNGNRTYYLSRSQPPFFSLMVELLAGIKGDEIYRTYLPQLEKEYHYWMEGAGQLQKGAAFKRVVKLKNGMLLNRYWDDNNTPRQESYKEDFELADKAAQALAMQVKMTDPEMLRKMLDDARSTVCRNLRAGACSGWDFSSRWFADEKNISTIQTTNIIPVDLNCLLYHLELTLEKAYAVTKQLIKKNQFNAIAATRLQNFSLLFRSQALDFFSDYNFVQQRTTDIPCASSLMILNYLPAASIAASGNAGSRFVKKYLLKAGGLQTTPNHTGQQWDAPNGWAPLQWVGVTALMHSGQKDLAMDIASRWIKLNEKVYAATGKLMEKYNVEDITKEAGGGEYSGQDGFGWTNGVYLGLKKLLAK